MTLFVKDVMVTSFDTIQTNSSIEEAIKIIVNGKVRESGQKTMSVMVVDEFLKLVGVVSIYDILYNLRPDFLNRGISGDDLSWAGQLKILVDHLKEKEIRQIMSRSLVGASPNEHLIVVLDRMIKNRYRRLPVLKDSKPVGIIYRSDIFHRLFKGYKH